VLQKAFLVYTADTNFVNAVFRFPPSYLPQMFGLCTNFAKNNVAQGFKPYNVNWNWNILEALPPKDKRLITEFGKFKL